MKDVEESEFLRHIACEECGSSDANSLYSDGHTHCFACGHRTWDRDGTEQTTRRKQMGSDFITGDARALPKRGVTEATCRKYGYWVGVDKDGKPVHIADYRNEDGELVAQKLRYSDKSFKVVGAGGNRMPLFGQHLWAAGGKRITITEGEIDALSLAQAQGNSWPVVSIPNGAQSAKKAVSLALSYLSTFDEVVFMFDMDEPGREAAVECAALLEPGKARIAELPRKDASEMLQAGEVKQLVSAVYQARVYRPDGIVSLDEIEERVLATPTIGRPWPFPHMTAATFGRRMGDVIGLGAGTGVGKTDLFTQIIAHDVLELGIKCGVIYLEQSVGETGRRVAGKAGQKRFHVPDGSWTEEELQAAWGRLKASENLVLYDHFGSMSWDTVRQRIRYMVTALGVEHVFLDHLTALAAAEDDERKALEKIMAEAAGMAQELGFILHYVSHLATPEGKPHEEGGRVMIRHFKGSRALGYWSHAMFGLERDQQGSSETRSITKLRCLKDRYTGQATGKVFIMKYHEDTGMLEELGEDDADVLKDESNNPDF